MNFIFIFISGVLLFSGLNIFLNDEIIVIPLQNQAVTAKAKTANSRETDRFEADFADPQGSVDMSGNRIRIHEPAGTKNLDALEHFVLANKASQNQQIDEAILYLMQALLIDPNYTEARLSLVKNLLHNGQRNLAGETLDQALAQHTDTSVFVTLRARMHVEDGHLQDASKILEDALARFHGDEELLVLAASVDGQLGDYQKAAGLFQQLVNIAPRNYNYQLGQAIAIEHTGDTHTAAHLYRMIQDKLAVSGTRLPVVEQRLAMLSTKSDQPTIQ
ncbi:MAG: tetratricopeptide repeat protein [Gammaproteobacteria bacterium]|nr:tetratricopeptide repeat protein [Gammaproteobacteria bacterium]